MSIEIPRGKVVEVARGGRRQRAIPGIGLLDSMGVVWKHWRESFRQNRDFSDIHGTFTEQYPEERPKLPEAYRNMPILLFDEATGHELCTSCFQCQRICPPQVIHMTQAKDPTTGKAVPAVAEFIIEYDACMSCGFCAEVCPFDAIKMDHEFELSTSDHPSLTVYKQDLNRPISYYEGIAPTMWAEVRDGAMKKLQGNIKRRPDVIGLAPQLTEKIAARRRELAEQAAAAPPPPPAAPAAAPAEARKLTPEEKAAKLAAIKAANAAKATGEAQPIVAPAEEPTLTPAEAKAAKLAAIKAANAAKKAAAEGTAPAAEAPAPVAPPADPADAKAAKLAAIRAANAAKQAGDPAPAAEAPAPVASPADPADAKAAKLAAIRAANAAKKAAEDPGTEA
ncbi:MAG: 4Fe-4S dicluster domain-containing protein [Oscillochloridaceae bacterium umkhey_bin13]